jgi:hypothetical protein
VVMLPDRAGEAIESLSIVRDRAGVEHLLSQAVTPAALIPGLPVEAATQEAPRPGVVLLDKPTPNSTVRLVNDDGRGKAVIADFNDTHTWEEVSGQELRLNRFCATWRGDDKPSVVINKDGRTATDYGRTVSGKREVYDRFEVYCLANGLDKKAEIKRRIAEYRAPVAREKLEVTPAQPSTTLFIMPQQDVKPVYENGLPTRLTVCCSVPFQWDATGKQPECSNPDCPEKQKRIAS